MKFRDAMRNLWTVEERPPSRMGKTNGKPDMGQTCFGPKKVWINNRSSLKKKRQTAVHEAIHIECPDLDEAAVFRAELTVCALLRLYGMDI